MYKSELWHISTYKNYYPWLDNVLGSHLHTDDQLHRLLLYTRLTQNDRQTSSTHSADYSDHLHIVYSTSEALTALTDDNLHKQCQITHSNTQQCLHIMVINIKDACTIH